MADRWSGGLLDVGEQVAGYEVEAFVARGGMAVVYRARDIALGRSVALKVIAPELASHEKFRQRFMRESELAASIDHPNVIPIYAAGEAGHLLYLAMRYVIGEDLGTVLRESGALGPREALPLFTQVAGALDAAHARQLVHRDVKPGNILLAGDDDLALRHVYLSDFGLTKRMSSLTGLTTAGHFLGTIQYVAPEQVAGRAVDHRSDIYSLGCVIYEALAGEPPFVRDDDAALLWSHMTQDAPPISSRRLSLPETLDPVLRRAMSKDPDDRQQNCQTLLGEVRSAFRPTPKAAFQPAAPSRSPSTEAPTEWVPAARSAAHALAVPAPAWSGTDRAAHHRPRKRPGWLVWGAVAVMVGLVGVIGSAGSTSWVRRLWSGESAAGSPGRESVLPRSSLSLADEVMVWRRERQGLWRIGTVSVDGVEGPYLVTDGVGAVLSRDRRTVLYHQGDDAGRRTLRAVSVDGRQDVSLFSESEDCPKLRRPAWGPDDLLAVACTSEEEDHVVLTLMTIDGRVVRRLDEGWLGDPTFVRGGRSVVYWANTSGGDGDGGALFEVAVDGRSDPVQLTQGGDGVDADPAGSPDGLAVAFRHGQEGERRIQVLPLDAGGGASAKPIPLTSGRLNDQSPSWSPDGSQIAFSRGPDEDSDLYVMPASGEPARSIQKDRDMDAGLDSSPVWTTR